MWPLVLMLTAGSMASSGSSSNDFVLHPVSRCKTLYLVRHAEGFHNQAKANATRDGTHEPPHAVLFENVTGKTYWDAQLTSNGKRQCDESRLKMLVSEAAFAEPEVVVVSPLTRTLQTASLMYGPGSRPFVATELCREKIDSYICEGRRNVSELRKEFSHVDFSDVETDHDTWFYDRKEDDAATKVRARQFFQWIMNRPEHTIAVVSHKHFLRVMLDEFSALGDKESRRPFQNAEMQRFHLCHSLERAVTTKSNKEEQITSMSTSMQASNEQEKTSNDSIDTSKGREL